MATGGQTSAETLKQRCQLNPSRNTMSKATAVCATQYHENPVLNERYCIKKTFLRCDVNGTFDKSAYGPNM